MLSVRGRGDGYVVNNIKRKQLWDESYELEQLIFRELNKEDGLTDNELTERLKSEGINFNLCRNLCLQLEGKGLIKRDRVQGEPIKNRIIKGDEKGLEQVVLQVLSDEGDLTDNEVAERLKNAGIPSYTSLNLCYQLTKKGCIQRVSVQGRPLVNRIVRDI